MPKTEAEIAAETKATADAEAAKVEEAKVEAAKTDEVKAAEAKVAEETKTAEEAKAAKEAEEAEAATKDKTMGELNEDLKPGAKDSETVPLATFLDMKKDNKELKTAITDLIKTVKEGAPKAEISSDLKEMAEKHGASPELLTELVAKLKSDSKSEIEEALKPFLEKDKVAKIDKIFNENYDKVIEAMPEYKDVANKDVIKALALDPANRDKTFAQILESSYGHLITGKKTLEDTKPGATKVAEGEVDMARASKDTEYFKEVMADPALKKKYNAGLAVRINL